MFFNFIEIKLFGLFIKYNINQFILSLIKL